MYVQNEIITQNTANVTKTFSCHHYNLKDCLFKFKQSKSNLVLKYVVDKACRNLIRKIILSLLFRSWINHLSPATTFLVNIWKNDDKNETPQVIL